MVAGATAIRGNRSSSQQEGEDKRNKVTMPSGRMYRPKQPRAMSNRRSVTTETPHRRSTILFLPAAPPPSDPRRQARPVLLLVLFVLTTTTSCFLLTGAESTSSSSFDGDLSSFFPSLRQQLERRRSDSKRRLLSTTSTSSTPTKVTGYGSRGHPTPGSVVTISTTTVIRRPGNPIQKIVSQHFEQPNHDNHTTAPLYLKLRDDDDDGGGSGSSIVPSTETLLVYSRWHNTTICLGGSDACVAGDKTLATTTPPPNEDDLLSKTNWIPVEGLYGVYQLPSGSVYVWIVASEVVFESHPLKNWKIRKVTELYLVHVVSARPQQQPDSSSLSSSSSPSSPEERRQLSLLRQALKEHEWYYCGGGGGDGDEQVELSSASSSSSSKLGLIPDLTRNLQASLLRAQFLAQNNNASSSSTAQSDHGALLLRNNSTADEDVSPFYSDSDLSAVEEAGNNSGSHEDDDDSDRLEWESVVVEERKQAKISHDDDEEEKNKNQTEALGNDVENRTDLPFTRGAWWKDPERQPDARFFWNQVALEPITDNKVLLDHAIPVTSAFCSVRRNLLSNTFPYDQVLLTRRSRFRVGTRFTKRGADALGHVANYAETEQILFTKDFIASYVQTRGSIPLRWSSPTDIKTYRPRIRIGTDPLAQARALRAHLIDEATRYILAENAPTTISTEHPSLIFVNLIDKKSDQERLGRALDAVLSAVLDVYQQDYSSPQQQPPWLHHGSIEHIWYDFHANVKAGRWDRLVDLLDTVQDPLLSHDYFCLSVVNGTELGGIERLQRGVVRTNCMDCLDRTNVVQSIFGRYMLFQQLSKHLPSTVKAAFRRNPLTIPWSDGEKAHRHLWADNADAISRLYAGTPALKGDFTRTGKRTKKGALDDGMNSLQRYYLNNFLDADRQEGMDLLTGHEPFSNTIDLDLDDENDSDNDSVPSWTSLRRQGMTVQEAARQMLLEPKPLGSKDDDDERHFARIKVKKRQRRRQRRPLDLRWLPGDLQMQVRSLITSFERDSYYRSLQAMDQRAAAETPWWVIPDTSDDDNEETADKRSPSSNVSTTTINTGFMFGALIAGTQAPLAMATVVTGLLATAFSSSEKKTP